MKRILAALVAILILPLTAQAHETPADPIPLEAVPYWVVDQWIVEWALENVELLDRESLGEWRWMRDTYFPPPPVIVEPVRESRIANRESSAPSGYTGMGTNVEQWRTLVAAYFPADQVDLALAVMSCESGGNPNAFNSAYGASGLMQVLRSWADNFGYVPADLFDPSINLYVASILYYDGGWAHWNASRHCWG